MVVPSRSGSSCVELFVRLLAVLPFAKVLRKLKLSEPPPADVRFYNNAFTTTKNKSYFIKLVNKTIKEVLFYNFKYIAA